MQTKEKIITLKPSPANERKNDFGNFKIRLEIENKLQGCFPIIDY